MKKTNNVILIVSGIISLIFGISILFVPQEIISDVAKYMGLILMLAGAVVLLISFMGKEKEKLRNMQIVAGIAVTVIGAFIFFFTAKSIFLFLILFGIWCVIIGFVEFAFAFRVPLDQQNKNVLVILGILTVALGTLLFFNPFDNASNLVKWIAALLSLLDGVGAVYFGIILKEEVEAEKE